MSDSRRGGVGGQARVEFGEGSKGVGVRAARLGGVSPVNRSTRDSRQGARHLIRHLGRMMVDGSHRETYMKHRTQSMFLGDSLGPKRLSAVDALICGWNSMNH
eukprot:1783602-Pyramimonas_sp.AAC.1